MTEPPHAENDVPPEDEFVQVPPAAAELAESIEHNREPGFIADIPDWDAEDPLP